MFHLRLMRNSDLKMSVGTNNGTYLTKYGDHVTNELYVFFFLMYNHALQKYTLYRKPYQEFLVKKDLNFVYETFIFSPL